MLVLLLGGIFAFIMIVVGFIGHKAKPFLQLCIKNSSSNCYHNIINPSRMDLLQ